jgi:hypothetical protein
MKLKLTTILSALLIIMSSCTTTTRHNYILLIDNSRTISENTQNKYISIIQETILLNMERNDRLTILFIDECSLIQAERVFTLDLASTKFENKTDGLNNAADSTKTRMKRLLSDSIQRILKTQLLEKRDERRNCGNYTDIISALNEATALISFESSFYNTKDIIINNALGKENYKYKNCIIIFSDMVNEDIDGKFNFTNFGKLNQKQIDYKLEELINQSKIPSLSGCSIIIYGATSTKSAGKYANMQIENCKKFWQKFFLVSGAYLKGYAFDSQKEIAEFMTH